MSNKYENQVREEWEKIQKNKPYPNIMLLGQTGCGKSSLINLVFGKDLAKVNDVSRGTENFAVYKGKDHGLGVNLIDSRGYEMEDGSGESFKSYSNSIKNKMRESFNESPFNKIHIIWYCISIATQRIQPYDIEILKLLYQDNELRDRVCVVLTKCDEDFEDGRISKEFKCILADKASGNAKVFEVSTSKNLQLELENLIDWSANQLNENDLKEAFIASQKFSLKEKQKAAQKRIAYHAAAAAAIGATPIPVADSMLLIPLQIEMTTNIIFLYGIDGLAQIPSAVITDIVVSNLGKSIVGGLLKLIPGIGTIAGSAINGTVAALITSALGFAFSQICYTSCEKILKGEYVDMSNMFNADDIRRYTEIYMKNNKK